AVVNSYFGDVNVRSNTVILTHKNKGNNILTWELLNEVNYIDRIIRGHEIDPVGSRKVVIPRNTAILRNTSSSPQVRSSIFSTPENLPTTTIVDESQYISYEALCATSPKGGCSTLSVSQLQLNIWKTYMKNNGSQPEIFVFHGLSYNFQNDGFVPETLLGSFTKEACVREIPLNFASKLLNKTEYTDIGNNLASAHIECISNVKAFLMLYNESDRPYYLKRNLAWESVFLGILKDNPTIGSFSLSCQAFRSRDDELKSNTSGSNDIIFVKSIVCCFGGCSSRFAWIIGWIWFDEFIWILICPFLIMGIGVDDMFVVINSYSLTYMIHSPEERCSLALKEYNANVCFSFGTKKTKNGKNKSDSMAKAATSTHHKEIDRKFKEISTYSLVTYKVRLSSDEKTTRSFTPLPSGGADVRSSPSGGNRERVDRSTVVTSTTRKTMRNCIQNSTSTNRTSLTRSSISSTDSTFISPISCLPPNSEQDTHNSQSLPVLPAVVVDLVETASQDAEEASDEEAGNEQDPSMKASNFSIVNVMGEDSSADDPSSIKKGDKQNNILAKNASIYSLNDSSTISKYELAKQAIFEEPRGSVGRKWRLFFLKYYGPFLMHPFVKVAVLFLFAGFLAFSTYGFTRMQQGLDLSELAPNNSYLKSYDRDYLKHFNTLDLPVDIIFTKSAAWWTPSVQNRIRELNNFLIAQNSIGLIINPFLRILDDPQLNHKLVSGHRDVFEKTLYAELNDPKSPYKSFEYDFVWQGRNLISWRLKIFPIAVNTSNQRAQFMINIRKDCALFGDLTSATPLNIIPYSYMMIFYESDLGNLKSVLLNMVVAAAAMLMVSFALLPDISIGIFVIVMITLIDVGLFGFMTIVHVKLNMVSSIAMVISIGFAVDYSAHMCHTFTHCEGSTRKLRVIESLVLMGNPVLHGAFSTFLGLLMLGFSKSYIFLVFFKMLTLVVLFGALHGLVLLPVILSFIGPFSVTHTPKEIIQSNFSQIEDIPPTEKKPTPPSNSKPKTLKVLSSTPAELPALPHTEENAASPQDTQREPPIVGTTTHSTNTTSNRSLVNWLLMLLLL
ncbi:patched family protein, partial [Cardiosporidium cionae]